jgi:diguanylate cyclase (GGDEF)-like protein
VRLGQLAGLLRTPSIGRYVVVAAALAFVPLALATLTFGHAFRTSETNRADTHLAAELRVALDAVDAAATSAAAAARRTAESRGTQTALIEHRAVPVAAGSPRWLQVSVSRPGEPRPPDRPQLLRRTVSVVSQGRAIGVVDAVVSLPALLAATGNPAALEVDGRITTGPLKGLPLRAARDTASTVRIGKDDHRVVVKGLDPRVALAATLPKSNIDASVHRRQLLTFGAGALTLVALALAALLLLSGRAPRGMFRAGRGHRSPVALVGDVAAAAHDPRALLPVLLETAVVATSAAGGHVVWDDEQIASIGQRQAGGAPVVFPLDEHAGTAGPVREIVLYPRRGGFTDGDENVAQSLVAQGRIALENARLQSVVRRQAVTDELTDLANRRRFMEVINLEVARAARLASPLTLVLFDLDHFKQINDRFGHQVGDAVLRSTAAVIRGRVRETDISARVGGEEFAVLLPGTDLSGGQSLAENLRRDLSRLVEVPGHDWRLTASFGVAEFVTGEVADTLIASADRSLYQAKEKGRDRVCLAAREEFPAA